VQAAPAHHRHPHWAVGWVRSGEPEGRRARRALAASRHRPLRACRTPGPGRHGRTGCRSDELETTLAEMGITLTRPAMSREQKPPGRQFSKPSRQIIEPVNQTVKAQSDLEPHGRRTARRGSSRLATPPRARRCPSSRAQRWPAGTALARSLRLRGRQLGAGHLHI